MHVVSQLCAYVIYGLIDLSANAEQHVSKTVFLIYGNRIVSISYLSALLVLSILVSYTTYSVAEQT